MRTVHAVLLVAVIALLCQGLASAATVDYAIRAVSVGTVAGLPTNFMREVIQVRTGDSWIGLTDFLSNTVPTALQNGALPPNEPNTPTLMRNVPVDSGKLYVPKGPKPIWLRVVATPAAGITYRESRGERGKGTMAHCWKWSSHFVSTFQAWATVNKFVRRSTVKIPVCEPTYASRKSYYFVDP